MVSADDILEFSRSRLNAYLTQGWNTVAALKRLLDQTIRDYDHRAIYELIQNAHDAHPPDERAGRIRILLDLLEGDHGVVYVANGGRPFTRANFDAITDVAASDKSPDEGIGNKGIGFKCVLQLTANPEVYSLAEGPDTSPLRFRFAERDDFAALLPGISPTRVDQAVAEVPHLCLPVPLRSTPASVEGLFADGFVTVIRLPLKSSGSRSEVMEQLNVIEDGPPPLLFLRRLRELSVAIREDDETTEHVLTRHETTVHDGDGLTVQTVDLTGQPTYVVFERAVDREGFAAAIQQSVAEGRVSETWSSWDGDAHVSIALPVDGVEPLQGRLYTFLPMGPSARSPLPAHLNAPFFARLARVDLEQTVPLNHFLLDELAYVSAAACLLAAGGAVGLGPKTIADLLSWSGQDSVQRLSAAFARCGTTLDEARVVPALGGRSFASLAEVFIWPGDDQRTLTDRRTIAESARCLFTDPVLDGERAQELEEVAVAVGRSLKPDNTRVAQWLESAAERLAKRKFDPEQWADFYDELAAIGVPARFMRGRRVLLDDEMKLQPCLDADGGRARTPLFSPRSDLDSDESEVAVKLPRRLRRHVTFLHGGITWNRRDGSTTRARPGRIYLQNGLVSEYRASELFGIIGEASTGRSLSNTAASELFEWTARLVESSANRPWAEVPRTKLRVLTQADEWIPAAEAFFGHGWGGPEKEIDDALDRLMQEASPISEELGALRRRLVAPPTSWPKATGRAEFLREFLERLGVRHGLWPEPVPVTLKALYGRALSTGRIEHVLAGQRELPVWRKALTTQPGKAQRPETPYLTQGPQVRIPGQADHEELSATAKYLYARLLIDGLQRWDDRSLSIEYRRYNDSNDRISIPTPVAAFVQHAAWLPEGQPGMRDVFEYRSPAETWSHREAEDTAPTYVPMLPKPLRNVLARSEQAQSRLRELGLGFWDDEVSGNERIWWIRDLFMQGDLADSAVVPALKDHQKAWVDAIRSKSDPLGDAEGESLLVYRKAAPGFWDTKASELLYVEDVVDKPLRQLLERFGKAVFRLNHERGNAVADYLMQALGERALRFSDCSTDVAEFGLVDDRPLSEGCEWLAQLVVAMLDTWAGFERPTVTTLTRARQQLSLARVRRVERFELAIGGEAIDAAALSMKSVMSSGTGPVIVTVVDGDHGSPDFLEQIAPQIAELCDVPYIGDALRLKLIELHRSGFTTQDPPALEDIAHALGEEADVVRQHWASASSEVAEVLARLVPYAGLVDRPAALSAWNDASRFADRDSVLVWFATSTNGLGSSEVASLLIDEGPTQRVLDLFGTTPADVDDVIAELGPPLRPITSPVTIGQQFGLWKQRNDERISLAVRAAFIDDYESGRDLSVYISALQQLGSIEADETWPAQYLDLPDIEAERLANRCLAAAGCPELGAGLQLEPVSALRLSNRALLESKAETIELLLDAWRLKSGEGQSPPHPISGAADRAVEEGLLDFSRLMASDLPALLQRLDIWPAAMPLTLEPKALGLTDSDISSVREAADRNRQAEQLRRRQITFGGEALTIDRENYPALVQRVRDSANAQLLQRRTRPADLDAIASGKSSPGGAGASRSAGSTQGDNQRLTAQQTTGIGLVGEVLALEWLKVHYEGVTEAAWKSGYRNQVLGLSDGSDDLGYDFEVFEKRRRLLFEVKATAGNDTVFRMSPGEMRRAQSLQRGEEYRIIFIRRVLDPGDFEIIPLANPFVQKSQGQYRFVGDGVRVEFKLNHAANNTK